MNNPGFPTNPNLCAAHGLNKLACLKCYHAQPAPSPAGVRRAARMASRMDSQASAVVPANTPGLAATA